MKLNLICFGLVLVLVHADGQGEGKYQGYEEDQDQGEGIEEDGKGEDNEEGHSIEDASDVLDFVRGIKNIYVPKKLSGGGGGDMTVIISQPGNKGYISNLVYSNRGGDGASIGSVGNAIKNKSPKYNYNDNKDKSGSKKGENRAIQEKEDTSSDSEKTRGLTGKRNPKYRSRYGKNN